MWPMLLTLATGEAKAEIGAVARRALAVAIAGLVAAVLLLFAFAFGLLALFFWLEPAHGPVVAALLTGALALVLALVALLAAKLSGNPAPRRKGSAGQAFAGQGPASPLALALGALVLGLLVGRKV
jgi:hypothetical protein